jgi:hypothetical protein
MRLDAGRMRTGSMLSVASLAVALFVTACHGAGPYGHAPQYAPTDDETKAVSGTREFDPVMVQRQPEEWRAAKTALFGVVESRSAGPSGQALLKLGVRRLDGRNLCESAEDPDSCRVTVSDRDFGVVWALVSLHGDDDVGPRSVGLRSLLRLTGSIGQDVGPDGAPMLHATWYRHWPALYYVTRASARDMKQ